MDLWASGPTIADFGTLRDSTAPPPPPPPPPSGPIVPQDYTVTPPPLPLIQSAPRAGAFVLHGQTETITPHSVVASAQIIDDTQARIDRIEQRIRSMNVYDGVIGWDRYDDLPVAAFPVEFYMLDIERYTSIGCPRIHL